jgi:prophage regulatory protein
MDITDNTETYCPPTHECFLRLPEVRKRTGLSRSSIYDYSRKGKFPRPVRLGLRGVGWPESEITAWIKARILQARPPL